MLTQDTLNKILVVPEVSADHVLPSQLTMMPLLPTALQKLLLTQETPFKVAGVLEVSAVQVAARVGRGNCPSEMMAKMKMSDK